MSRQVVYTRRAQSQLAGIERYITRRGSPANAKRFVEAIVNKCAGLADASWQGTKHDELLPSLRTTGFRNRTTIAFRVTSDRVFILSILYGGRDIESNL